MEIGPTKPSTDSHPSPAVLHLLAAKHLQVGLILICTMQTEAPSRLQVLDVQGINAKRDRVGDARVSPVILQLDAKGSWAQVYGNPPLAPLLRAGMRSQS